MHLWRLWRRWGSSWGLRSFIIVIVIIDQSQNHHHLHTSKKWKSWRSPLSINWREKCANLDAKILKFNRWLGIIGRYDTCDKCYTCDKCLCDTLLGPKSIKKVCVTLCCQLSIVKIFMWEMFVWHVWQMWQMFVWHVWQIDTCDNFLCDTCDKFVCDTCDKYLCELNTEEENVCVTHCWRCRWRTLTVPDSGLWSRRERRRRWKSKSKSTSS